MSYTSIDLCHRFARFTVSEKNKAKINAKIHEFIGELKSVETGVLYHRLQKDEDTSNEGNESQLNENFNLCIVVDPQKNSPPLLPIQENCQENVLPEEIVVINEENINAEDDINGKLSTWVKLFYKSIGPYCGDTPIYFELRPLSYKNN